MVREGGKNREKRGDRDRKKENMSAESGVKALGMDAL